MSANAARRAFVTGGGSGFGREIALGLADGGWSVAVLGDSGHEAETGERLATLGVKGAAVASALDSRAAADAAFAEAADALGRPELVVHARVGSKALAPALVRDLDDAAIDAACEAEIRCSLFCLQAAHGLLHERGGRIVVVTPTLALSGAAARVAYAAACEAQRSMVKSAARQWGSLGITVNCVAPSLDALLRAEGLDDATKSRILADAPLGGSGEIRPDVAPVVALLAEPGAHFLTGQTLRVDGGSWLAG